ncbi:MAG: DUF885 domain-containing protein [Wenzhouxiangella sp.]|nr:MAG: DUF885 domain-containing protein [Wenzhouxiangella sp.]
MSNFRNLFSMLAVFMVLACSPQDPAESPAGEGGAPNVADVAVAERADRDQAGQDDALFTAFAESWIEELLALEPEWAIYQGRYEWADQVTIPNVAGRAARHEFLRSSLDALAHFDPVRLTPPRRAEYRMLKNRMESMLWYQDRFRNWQWMPSVYNVAGPISVLLNTDFAPEDERLGLVSARLAAVPAFFEAARDNIDRPPLEHVELAMIRSRGALAVFDDDLLARVRASSLSADDIQRFEERLAAAQAAIEDWIDWLDTLEARLRAEGTARSFRIGETLFEEKFAFDVQADVSARELYERALQEQARLHEEMDEIAVDIWSRHFPDRPMPDEPLERIGELIDYLSDRHVAIEDFVPEIRRQIPALAEFVTERDLLDQDPDKPLIVRETPEYLRGAGNIASVSAPGPFNPGAETFYNVTPLETYGPEMAASYLREYNHWILQILNIHEAIPGHYTQLLHANRSPSLVKSLFGNGAMIEGWAVYAERMMLEEGWGDHEPELWLMYGKWALRVVTNAIIDYGVHVLDLEREEAIRLMREEAFQEASEATEKWRRATLSQVQLSTYFSGFAEIYDFRERRKAELGEAFKLRDFHNEFLSYGSAPVAVIVDLMEKHE